MVSQCLKTLVKTLVALVLILVTARFLHVSLPIDDWIDFSAEIYSKLNGSVPVPIEATTWTVI